jgi:hypothetical protein
LGEMPSFSAISLTVKNSLPFTTITQYIGRFGKNVNKYTRRLENTKQMFSKIYKKLKKLYLLGIYALDIYYTLRV